MKQSSTCLWILCFVLRQGLIYPQLSFQTFCVAKNELELIIFLPYFPISRITDVSHPAQFVHC